MGKKILIAIYICAFAYVYWKQGFADPFLYIFLGVIAIASYFVNGASAFKRDVIKKTRGKTILAECRKAIEENKEKQNLSQTDALKLIHNELRLNEIQSEYQKTVREMSNYQDTEATLSAIAKLAHLKAEALKLQKDLR